MTRHLPSADLDFFVERYWIVRWDLRGKPPYRQETLPHPAVNLVVEPGHAAIHGLGTRRSSVLLEGEGAVFGIKFRPGAFHGFTALAMTEMKDRVVAVAEVFGPAGDAMAVAVRAADGDADRQIAVVEDFLRPRLPARDDAVATVVRVVQVALDTPQLTHVEDLVAHTGVPLRTMQRLFRRCVGVSPKWCIRRFRLHEAADRVAAGAVVDWSALAHDLGYCDQAHFIRDFTDQVGRSPTAYAAECAARPTP